MKAKGTYFLDSYLANKARAKPDDRARAPAQALCTLAPRSLIPLSPPAHLQIGNVGSNKDYYNSGR